MGSNQRYNLRWNDFHSTLASSFSTLRNDSDFIDVTLACDGQSFAAHKVVLSACSVYLKKLLKANPCQHPIVILRDVRAGILNSLLHFMYHGAVDISQNQLTDFLHAAQLLEIKGLSEDSSPSRDLLNSSCPNIHIPTSHSTASVNLPTSLSAECASSPPPKKQRPVTHRISSESSSTFQLGSGAYKSSSLPSEIGKTALSETNDKEEIISDLHSVVGSLKVGHTQSVQSGELTIARISKPLDVQEDSSSTQENLQCPDKGLSSTNQSQLESKDFKEEFELDYSVNAFPMKQEPFDGDTATSFEEEEMIVSHSPKSETVISGYSDIGVSDPNAGSPDVNSFPGTSGTNQAVPRGTSTSRDPQTCPYCKKNFSTRGNLNLHIRNVHLFIDEQNWVSCSYCPKKFKTKERLTVHQYYAHNVRIRQPRSHMGMK